MTKVNTQKAYQAVEEYFNEEVLEVVSINFEEEVCNDWVAEIVVSSMEQEAEEFFAAIEEEEQSKATHEELVEIASRVRMLLGGVTKVSAEEAIRVTQLGLHGKNAGYTDLVIEAMEVIAAEQKFNKLA